MMRECGSAYRFPWCRGEQDGSHAGCLADANGAHIRLDVLDGVVNSKARRHDAARRVYVNGDILVRVFVLKENELRHDEVGNGFVNFLCKENNALFKQPGIDVVGTFTATGLLDYYGN